MAAPHVPKLGEWDNSPWRRRMCRSRSIHGGAACAEAGRFTTLPALSPPRNLYRDLIRKVAVSGGKYTRLPVHTGSSSASSSGASSSYYSQTNSSGCSSGSATTAAIAEFCDYNHELTMTARRMVKAGYTRRIYNEFGSGGPDLAPLQTWFLELDVDWVLEIHEDHGLRRQLEAKPTSSLKELVDKWIRALTVIDVSIRELLGTGVEETAVALFGKASMAKMLVFVDAIIPALKEEKLQAVVDMYVCVSNVSYRSELYSRATQQPISREAQRILKEIGSSLLREEIKLSGAISRTMKEVMALLEEDDLWAIDILRGRGEVHRNTRFMVDYIMSMLKVRGSMSYTPQGRHFYDLIDDFVRRLKDLLLRKSELCSDPSLRYLFLLNNFYSVAQLPERRPGGQWVHTPEYKLFMDNYLDASWGHVLSHIQKTVLKDSRLDVSCGHVLLCIPKTGFHEWHQHRKKTSSLVKFESAFHKTYQAQKFWKVPDPQLRNALRSTIIDRVISDYRCYLKKHPEIEKHVHSNPDVLKEMLEELFEG